MNTKVSLIFSGFALIFFLASCFKGEVYPNEPYISDPLFVISNDSAVLTFSFTDGDGDIGISDGDTLPPSPFVPNSYYYFNLYLEYYEKVDGSGWQPGLDFEGDSIVFAYRLEPIIVKGKKKGIKGTMDIAINPFYNIASLESDTIKYRIKLIDRALNESNYLETGEIYPFQ